MALTIKSILSASWPHSAKARRAEAATRMEATRAVEAGIGLAAEGMTKAGDG